ncbi:MAG: hypothetical protein ACLFUJ_13570 [Phycisphaerae bacterium]
MTFSENPPDPGHRRPWPDRLPGLRWLLGYRGLGRITRRNFRYDLISEILFALAVG